jgi:hypothetical protein
LSAFFRLFPSISVSSSIHFPCPSASQEGLRCMELVCYFLFHK